jgi:transposase
VCLVAQIAAAGGAIAAPAGNGHAATVPAITADQAEIRRLRWELERVQTQRDIATEAIGIFSRP